MNKESITEIVWGWLVVNSDRPANSDLVGLVRLVMAQSPQTKTEVLAILND